jgi:arylsulfatase A-like enzyme
MDPAMRLSRRALLAAGAGAPAILKMQAQNRLPNIVFLISDDHSAPDLGCYGNKVIQTPNLDRMAAEGVRFHHCYVASPQCSPNRSAIFTGCTPHTTSTSRLHTPMPPWERTYIEPLKEKGYFVGAFRKVHQGKEFDKRWDFYGSTKTPFEEFFEIRPRNRPFFLHVGFIDPHRPYQKGAFNPPHDPAKVTVPPFLPDTPEVRQDLALYHDEIARMDSECGQIFSLLEKHGVHENTLVIFTGDNGMPFPRAKGTLYDPGICVPMLAWWPGRVKAGSVCDHLIPHVDLPATWLDIAGAERPAKMQGRSFLNLLTGGSYNPHEAVFSERNWHDNFDPMRCVRTRRYKLIFNAAPHFPYRPAWDLADSMTWKSIQQEARRGTLTPGQLTMMAPARPVLELYDLEQDPHEFTNLAGSAAHQDVLQDLQRRLSEWMHETMDYLPPGITRPGEPRGRDWPLSL